MYICQSVKTICTILLFVKLFVGFKCCTRLLRGPIYNFVIFMILLFVSLHKVLRVGISIHGGGGGKWGGGGGAGGLKSHSKVLPTSNLLFAHAFYWPILH